MVERKTSRGRKVSRLETSRGQRFAIKNEMTDREIVREMKRVFDASQDAQKQLKESLRHCRNKGIISYSDSRAQTYSAEAVLAWINYRWRNEPRHRSPRGFLSHSDGRPVALEGCASISEAADSVLAKGRPRPLPGDINGCHRRIEELERRNKGLEDRVANLNREVEQLTLIAARHNDICNQNRINGGIRHP